MEAKINKQEEAPQPIQPVMVSDLLNANANECNAEIVPQEEVKPAEAQGVGKSFTLDVSSQTLQMLAEAVAKKICDDITNSDMAGRLIEAGGYKRDNEILAKQVQELLAHNKELSSRIEQLESRPSRSLWDKIWGKG